MNTELENVVVLSINEYNKLIKENERLIEQNKAIHKGLKVHIDYGGWYGFSKNYEILNASDSEIKLRNEIMNLEKKNSDKTNEINNLKSMQN